MNDRWMEAQRELARDLARGALSAHLSHTEGKRDMLNGTMQRTIEEARGMREARIIEQARQLHLTRKERLVLGHLCDGVTNDGLARAMGISPHTAKFHVNNLLTKFSARSRVHIVCIAFRAGLVT